MKIRCVDGYFMFREQRVGEISDFISLFKLDLVSKEDYFTFAVLADAPNYALAGAPYLNATAIKTFAGRPWEVMRENDLVYNFETGKLVPLLSVTRMVQIDVAGNYLFSQGLILPGSMNKAGQHLTDYVGWFSKETMKFKYSEVTYV